MSDNGKDSKRQEYRERNNEYAREWRERNRERLRAYQREYYEHNKDKMNERSRAYSSEHVENRKAYQKAYYERNKDKLVAYSLEKHRRLHDEWDGSKDELDIKIEEAAKKSVSNYPYKLSLRDIAEQLGVSRSTVRDRMIKMGIDTTVKDASEKVDMRIIDTLEEYRQKGLKRPSANDIANIVGVSASMVRCRMSKMGIDTSRGYTIKNKKIEEPEKDELNIKILKFIDEYTKENGSAPSLRKIGAEFGVSGQTISNRLDGLGVSKEKAHGPRKINDKLWEEMYKLIEQGIEKDGMMPQSRELSRKLDTSQSVVQRRLSKYGYTNYNYKERRTLVTEIIKEYMDIHHEVPSMKYIREKTGMGYPTISRILRELGYSTPRQDQLNGTSMIEVDRKILAMVHEAERRGVKRPTIQQIADETGISLSSARNRMKALGIDTSRQ